MKETKIFNAEISAGALMLAESRRIAELLLESVDDAGWLKAVVTDNILQKRSTKAAKRQAELITRRLRLMTPDLFEMVAYGSVETSTQALLAAAVKHSRLVGDFMDKVVRQHWRTFIKVLSAKDWSDFWDSCIQLDPAIDTWSDSTKEKLRQVTFKILAEAKYIDSTRGKNLLPVLLVPEVENYLRSNNETYVLRCLRATQS